MELRPLRAGHLADARQPDAESRAALRRGQHDHGRQRVWWTRATSASSPISASRRSRRSRRTSTTCRRALGVVWLPTADRKLAIRASAGVFYDQNHFNYNDIYVNQTLLANRRVNFNCNSTTDNPLYNAAEGLAAVAHPLSRVPGRTLSAVPERGQSRPDPGARRDDVPRLPYSVHACRARSASRVNCPATSPCRPTTSTRTARTCSCSATSIWISSMASVGEQGSALHRDQPVREHRVHQVPSAAGARRVPRTRACARASRTRCRRPHRTATRAPWAAALATNPLDLSVDDGPTNEDRRHRRDGRLVRVPARRSSLPASIATTARCRTA